MARPKGTTGIKKKKNFIFTVTDADEKGHTGRYTMTPAAQQQREIAAQSTALPIAMDPAMVAKNATRIQHVIAVNEIARNADRKDLLSLRSCFLQYLALCQQDGCSVGNLAAYAAMGFDNQSWQQWIHHGDEDRKEFARFVKRTCALFREGLVADGDLNPVIGIFWQRNFDGLRNDTEQVQAALDAEDVSRESNSYRKRYGNLIGMESDDK